MAYKEHKVLPIADLDFAEYNPRDISEVEYKALIRNIKRDPDFLEVNALMVNKRDGRFVVYAGNQRLRALRELGYTEVPVVLTQVSIEVERRRNIIHNRSNGRYNVDQLANMMEIEELKDIGFTDFELGIMPDAEPEEDSESDDGGVIQYNIIFNSDEEQQKFYAFLRGLKKRYPDIETHSGRLCQFIDEYSESNG